MSKQHEDKSQEESKAWFWRVRMAFRTASSKKQKKLRRASHQSLAKESKVKNFKNCDLGTTDSVETKLLSKRSKRQKSKLKQERCLEQVTVSGLTEALEIVGADTVPKEADNFDFNDCECDKCQSEAEIFNFGYCRSTTSFTFEPTYNVNASISNLDVRLLKPRPVAEIIPFNAKAKDWITDCTHRFPFPFDHSFTSTMQPVYFFTSATRLWLTFCSNYPVFCLSQLDPSAFREKMKLNQLQPVAAIESSQLDVSAPVEKDHLSDSAACTQKDQSSQSGPSVYDVKEIPSQLDLSAHMAKEEMSLNMCAMPVNPTISTSTTGLLENAEMGTNTDLEDLSCRTLMLNQAGGYDGFFGDNQFDESRFVSLYSQQLLVKHEVCLAGRSSMRSFLNVLPLRTSRAARSRIGLSWLGRIWG